MALATSLGGDDDHTGIGLGTIYRCGRAVFQDLEALDVVGIEAGNGAGDKGGGIAAGKVVGTDVDVVLQNHAVDHPQGLAATIDRGSATHANLGRGTKGTRHVRHRHTGGTAFEAAAHVGHARELGLVGVDAGGSTGEGALVDFLITGHDHRVKLLTGYFQLNFHGARLSWNLNCLITHRRNHKCGFGGHCKCEFTIEVSSCTISSVAFLNDGCSDSRLIVFVEHNASDLDLGDHGQ